MQGNMKTTPAEFDVTFDFAIYLSSQKYDRKIERSKNLPKCFSPMVILYIPASKFVVFTSKMFLLMAKIIFHSRSTVPVNLLLPFLKTVYQY